MEIHQLQYVVAVANYCHFTRAAEEVCVAQSSLSHQITKLEEELGVKLFDRTTRAVYLTTAGQEFISYAREILALIDSAQQCMQGYVGLARGKINIGAITTLETIKFVPMITAFHQKYPGLNLNINLKGHSSHQIIEQIETSETDVGLITPPIDLDTSDLECYHIADDEFVLITSQSHPLANRGCIDLAEVACEHFIFPNPEQSTEAIFSQAFRDAGFKPNIVCRCSHSETTLALIAAGMAIGLFPLDTLIANSPPGIAIIHLAAPIKKHIAMILLKRPYYPPPVVEFREHVLAWTKQLHLSTSKM